MDRRDAAGEFALQVHVLRIAEKEPAQRAAAIAAQGLNQKAVEPLDRRETQYAHSARIMRRDRNIAGLTAIAGPARPVLELAPFKPCD